MVSISLLEDYLKGQRDTQSSLWLYVQYSACELDIHLSYVKKVEFVVLIWAIKYI